MGFEKIKRGIFVPRVKLLTKSGLYVSYFRYDFAVDGGGIGAIIPKVCDQLPIGSIIVASTLNATTAVTSLGSATVAVGTSAGSSASAILAATAKASLSANALLNGVPVFAAPVKLSAAGYPQITVAVAALTAGVIEGWLQYLKPQATSGV